MDWQTPPPDFRTVIFDLTQPADNRHRYYRVSWQTDLFGEGNVVRSYGRKGGWNRTLSQPFDSLEAAWPFIRRTIKTRLRHGYQLVEMEPAP
jgi:predicted DNA-binding WGR domain protein